MVRPLVCSLRFRDPGGVSGVGGGGNLKQSGLGGDCGGMAREVNSG